MGTAQASDYLENALIDHIFRTRTWAKPTALYLALYTSAPTDAGGGTEVAGGGYARVNLAPGNANWTATQGGTSGDSSGTGGATTNAVLIQFPPPIANWGTVTHFGIVTAASGGSLLIWDAIASPLIVMSGGPGPSFPAGSLRITVS
jgi:hypothetical protein